MLRIIFVIIMVLAAIFAIRYLRRQPVAIRRSLLMKYAFYGIIGVTITLALTGRIHWLGAAIAAAIPIIGKLAVLGLRFLPFLQQWRKYKPNHSNYRDKPGPKSTMTYAEAMELFGLTAAANRKQIIQRHRELMQKNHPDRGGSNYLAAKINEAKKVLLATAEK